MRRMTYIHAHMINKLGSYFCSCGLGPNILRGQGWGCIFFRNEQYQSVYSSPVNRSKAKYIHYSYKFVSAWIYSNDFSHGPDVGGGERFILDEDDISYSEVSLRFHPLRPGL